MELLNHCLELICLLLLVLCMAAPLTKKPVCQRYPLVRAVLSLHGVYGCLLISLGLWHGILSGKAPAMITGKLAWLVLVLCILMAAVQKKWFRKSLKTSHFPASILVCTLLAVHILHGLLT